MEANKLHGSDGTVACAVILQKEGWTLSGCIVEAVYSDYKGSVGEC
jgi:hypothetical protein